MEQDFYQRVKRTKNVGDSEFGNTDLSYCYCKKVLQREIGNINGLKILDIGTNRGTLPWKFYRGGG